MKRISNWSRTRVTATFETGFTTNDVEAILNDGRLFDVFGCGEMMKVSIIETKHTTLLDDRRADKLMEASATND